MTLQWASSWARPPAHPERADASGWEDAVGLLLCQPTWAFPGSLSSHSLWPCPFSISCSQLLLGPLSPSLLGKWPWGWGEWGCWRGNAFGPCLLQASSAGGRGLRRVAARSHATARMRPRMGSAGLPALWDPLHPPAHLCVPSCADRPAERFAARRLGVLRGRWQGHGSSYAGKALG